MEFIDQEFPLFSLEEIDIHGAEIARVTDFFEKIQGGISRVAVSGFPRSAAKTLFIRKFFMDEEGFSDLDSPPLMFDLNSFLEVDVIKLNIVKEGIGDPQRAPGPFDKSFEPQPGSGEDPADKASGRSFSLDHPHAAPAASEIGFKKEREPGAFINKGEGLILVIKDMCDGMRDVMDPQPVKKDTLVFIKHDLPVGRVDDSLHLPFEEKNTLIEHLFVNHPPGCGSAEKSAARALFETLYPIVGDDVDDPVGNFQGFTSLNVAFMKPVRLFEDPKHDLTTCFHVSSFLS